MDDVSNVLKSFVVTTLLNHQDEEEWTPSFRGSALPVCPRQLLLGKLYDGHLKKQWQFGEKYNLQIGHAIHGLVQSTWAKQGLLWGDWRCRSADCGVSLRNQRVSNCPRCGSEMEYVEKQIRDHDSGFSGHCDGVLYVDALKGYIVYELKSRNFNIIKVAEEPYDSDVFQVSAYATMLAKQFPIQIVGRMILWLGKPRPAPFKLWFYPGTGEKLFETQLRAKMQMDEAVAQGRPLDVVGTCTKPGDAVDKRCPFGAICFSDTRDQLVQEKFDAWVARTSAK